MLSSVFGMSVMINREIHHILKKNSTKIKIYRILRIFTDFSLDVGCLNIRENPFLRYKKNQYICKKSEIIHKNEKSGGPCYW